MTKMRAHTGLTDGPPKGFHPCGCATESASPCVRPHVQVCEHGCVRACVRACVRVCLGAPSWSCLMHTRTCAHFRIASIRSDALMPHPPHPITPRLPLHAPNCWLLCVCSSFARACTCTHARARVHLHVCTQRGGARGDVAPREVCIPEIDAAASTCIARDRN